MAATATRLVNKELLETSSEWLSRLPETLNQAIDQGREVGKRTWKQARRTAEDFSEEALYRVKKYPVQSVAITFGVALGMGALAGWYFTRRTRPKTLFGRLLAG